MRTIETIREICEESMHERYGGALPEAAEGRLDWELTAMKRQHSEELILSLWETMKRYDQKAWQIFFLKKKRFCHIFVKRNPV